MNTRLAITMKLFVASVACGCSTLGSDGDGMSHLPSGGSGPFRRVTPDEIPLALAVSTQGKFADGCSVLPAVTSTSTETAAAPQASLFYATASRLAEGEVQLERPAAPSWETPIEPYAARSISLSMPGSGPNFRRGEVIDVSLQGEQEAYDPGALRLRDGGARLYFMADQVVAVATLEGETWTRANRPVLARSGRLRHPSVIELEDGTFVLYVEEDTKILACVGDDGMVFDGCIVVLEPIGGEIAVGSPGAVRVRTSTGRFVTKLFFETRTADGVHGLALAGGTDSLVLSRTTYPIYVPDEDDEAPAAPAAWAVSAEQTLLYFSVSTELRREPSRALAVAVSPGGLVFEKPDAGMPQ